MYEILHASFLHNLNPNAIMHVKSYTAEKIKPIYYNKKKLMSTIDRLDKEDKDSLFRREKKLLKEKFGDDIASYVKSESLASNLLFINKYYIENKADDTKDVINLRSNIKDILNENTDMPESLYDILVDILIQNKAIDSDNSQKNLLQTDIQNLLNKNIDIPAPMYNTLIDILIENDKVNSKNIIS
jgi:hypothetical protein